jgi:hypothetical protein
MRRLATLIVTLGLFVVAACTDGGGEAITSPASTARPTTTAVATTAPPTTAPPQGEIAVYVFFAGYPVEPGPFLVPLARRGEGDVAEALTLLLEGVTEEEAAAGLSSPVPEGTRLLGVEVAGGVASVDLSGEFESGGGSLSVLGRVAEVVYTATQFEAVDAVDFLIDGTPVDVLTGEGLIVDRPQTRADYVDLVPAIFVDGPYWGSSVALPLSMAGWADVESGVVDYTVVDVTGSIVAEGVVQATPGAPRSEFAATVTASAAPAPGWGSLIVFETAPDGSQAHVLEYPLLLE